MTRKIPDEILEEEMPASEILALEITGEQTGMRLDKALAMLCPDFSRSRLQALIEQGQVKIKDGPVHSASRKVEVG